MTMMKNSSSSTTFLRKMNDTIVAIATANGVGSISIVRISGEMAYALALKLTKRENLAIRHAHLCKLYNGKGDFLDEAIVLYFQAPHSFTGENVVEFQIHGGLSTSQILLDECVRLGARLANAGEFSKRACLNGKMSLLKAVSINELINAKSILAAQIIAKNLSGKFGELLEKIRTDLVKTLAFVETCIDYADDDLPPDILAQTLNLYKENARILRQIAEISKSKKGLVEGFKIAIVGKANVGKSSLLNAMLAKNRAIVSNTAGTTRDRVEDELKIGTHLVRIIDTAGIRKSDDEVEQIGVKLSLAAIEEADIIIAVFDSSRQMDIEDEQIFKILKKCDKKIFFVQNKTDLKAEFQAPKGIEFIKISTKDSLAPLQEKLSNYLDSLDSEDFIITNALLIKACEEASKAIQRASQLLSEQNLELFAFECNEAIRQIAKFTHEFQSDEVLDEMFGNFCLGK